MNRLLIACIIGTLFACGNVNSQNANSELGKDVYRMYCVACHGSNGKLKLNDAADLTFSNLTLEERIENITEGGSMMPAFAEVISEEQIQAVAVYLDELKEQN